MKWVLVLTTAGSKREADAIARRLVKARLAACVNIIPRVDSVYRWKGKIERAREWLLIAKSRSGLFGKVAKEIKRVSSYECPEVISVPLQKGSPDYIKWLGAHID